MKEFLELIKQKSSDVEELLFNIASSLRYESVDACNTIFQYGEKANKFYIILKGKVANLIPEKQTLDLTQEEYFNYLINLKKANELDLLYKCIILNKNLFILEEEEANWLLGKTISLKGRKHSTPLEDFLFKLSVRDYTDKFKSEKFDVWQEGFYDNKSKKHFIKHLSPDDYIKLLSPKSRNSLNKNLYTNEEYVKNFKEVQVFIFNKVSTLETGSKFGDLALLSVSQIRNSTIITEEECHFGTLDKISFLKCLSDVSEKLNRINLSFLISQKIFSRLNMNLFQKNYFGYFVAKELKKGDFIANENKEANAIYFIKEGEFDVTANKSFHEYAQLVKYFGGDVNKHLKPLDVYRGIF